MARNLSLGYGGRIDLKRYGFLQGFWLAGLLTASLLLTGCSQELENPYVPESVIASLADGIPSDQRLAETFASNLCVIDGQAADPGAEVGAEAAAVFSLADHSVLTERHALDKMYPASMTKVMTALVAIRQGNLSDQVTVGQEAVITESGASLCRIKPGDSLTLEQLLYGLMLPSGNDAAAAIAVHIAGSMEAFSNLMNQQAHTLGATDTHFLNPHGLHDENHYTTAYDLYLIFQEALKEPVFRQLIAASSYTAVYTDADGNEKSQTWNNSNQYISGEQSAPDGLTVLGGKTGTTKSAGSCLIMGSMDDQQREYVSIVMKSASRSGLYQDMTNIIQKIVN